MDVLIASSISAMILFITLKRRLIGALAWILFSIAWLIKIPYYLQIYDYYNTAIVALAFLFFTILGITIAIDKEHLDVFADVTAFSALAALVYFPFAFSENLKMALVSVVTNQTVMLGNFLGFPMEGEADAIKVNACYISIILTCTGIESIALFTGATLGIKANAMRKFKAFLVSVPVVYILNLFRNIFVAVSYAYSWFGENSFYIAHHIVSKLLATLALILISIAVFKILPELAELIFSLKEVIARGGRN
jgi:archaeosortase A (PGF-CTERM-specific)